MAVVDVDDAGELGGEEFADGLDLLEKGGVEGVAAFAEEQEDGEGLALVAAGHGGDGGVGQPLGIVADVAVEGLAVGQVDWAFSKRGATTLAR